MKPSPPIRILEDAAMYDDAAHAAMAMIKNGVHEPMVIAMVLQFLISDRRCKNKMLARARELCAPDEWQLIVDAGGDK